ncbi:polysaccharide deacetylase family protein [Streptosporangium roseum]|uniref:Xylanase/chitin deacetylase-like protein n=1 Tax=Streptosporangium roseum (strain ATCC 12428 / DSM 43021 / JCM 3005 / KCTC 9067 / NCIMB 10171 / NRRL 2505 / NI 9100) TaxID=479432 RepID=D2B4J9_STRRD|nr:polysaccharide deacetylase family protein [Streptosporangium roseum]ACZ83685.1 xylanase/chitin deacetylase-like protein [Streptosporangium roseum DSM 43021]
MINYVDPSRVQGLSVRTMNGGDTGDRRVHVTYPSIDDAPRLSEKIRRTVTERLDRFIRDTSMNTALPHPEFNVDWQLAAASDQVVGVRLRTGESLGAGWSESRTTVWYDRVDRRALDSTALLRDGSALAELARIVRESLNDRGSPVDPRAVRPDAELFDSLSFNPHGELVVEFDDYQVSGGPLGRVAVAVPAAEVAPLLSATGLRAQRAAAGTARTSPPMGSDESIEAASTVKLPARSSKAGSVDCARVKCVALTYDDGPGPDTGRLLDILAGADARATFFSVGSNAAARPELLRRMRQEGHLVANHTWSHRDLTSLSTSRIADQIDRTQYTITQTIWQVPTLVRPPYGASSVQVASVARRLGLSVVRWSVDTEDRRDRDPGAIADRAVSRARPGAIVLMHDVHGATVDAAPEILRRLKEKGYTFVTVPELYGSRGMEPGRTYDSAASGGSSGKSGSVTRALEKQALP